jgi:hypothetical protein
MRGAYSRPKSVSRFSQKPVQTDSQSVERIKGMSPFRRENDEDRRVLSEMIGGITERRQETDEKRNAEYIVRHFNDL